MEAGNGGVKLSALPLFTGDVVPFVGLRGGDDCDGDRGVVACRAPSGESGVLQRSLPNTKKINKNYLSAANFKISQNVCTLL